MLGGLTSYQKFIKEEGIDSIKGFGVRDMKNIPVKPWDRMGGDGAYIDLDGTILKGEATVGQTNNAYICEIAPGKNLNPQKHIFEELIFVLSGRGATSVWIDGKKKGASSLRLSIPGTNTSTVPGINRPASCAARTCP